MPRTVAAPSTGHADTPFLAAAREWDNRIGSARVQARNWRLVALLSLALSALLAGGLIHLAGRAGVVPYIVEIDAAGQPGRITPATEAYDPTEAQIAHTLARWVVLVRSRPTDPVVVTRNWQEAYGYLTRTAAAFLNDYAREHDPQADIGRVAVIAEVANVLRRSEDTYQLQWRENRYEDGRPAGTTRHTGLFTVVIRQPRTEAELLANPLGLYIDSLSWHQEH
jgi:type IV secretion system protein VirB5